MRDHRGLEAWRVSHALAVEVIRLSRTNWRPWASALFNQLQRASLSVPLNIAEGATFGRSPTYARHLGIAYGSAVETDELIGIAHETGLLDPTTSERLSSLAAQSQRLLIGLLRRHRPRTPS